MILLSQISSVYFVYVGLDFVSKYNQNDFTVESHESGLFETNKIFALDQSLPSFQGETNIFSASLSIASFDKKKWAWFITSKEYVVILTPWQYRIGKSVK